MIFALVVYRSNAVSAYFVILKLSIDQQYLLNTSYVNIINTTLHSLQITPNVCMYIAYVPPL